MTALNIKCPVCQAAPGRGCYAVVLATCKTISLPEPHEARVEAATWLASIQPVTTAGTGAYALDATGDFTSKCHACSARTEHRNGQRVDTRCAHVLGVAYTETDLAVERVAAFLNVWKGHPSTASQVAAIYTRAKGEGERHPLLVRDLSLLLDALHPSANAPSEEAT